MDSGQSCRIKWPVISRQRAAAAALAAPTFATRFLAFHILCSQDYFRTHLGSPIRRTRAGQVRAALSCECHLLAIGRPQADSARILVDLEQLIAPRVGCDCGDGATAAIWQSGCDAIAARAPCVSRVPRQSRDCLLPSTSLQADGPTPPPAVASSGVAARIAARITLSVEAVFEAAAELWLSPRACRRRATRR